MERSLLVGYPEMGDVSAQGVDGGQGTIRFLAQRDSLAAERLALAKREIGRDAGRDPAARQVLIIGPVDRAGIVPRGVAIAKQLDLGGVAETQAIARRQRTV